MNPATRQRVRLAALTAAAVLTLTACDITEFDGVQDLPLPGGAALGDSPFQVTASFTNVLDLVPQSGVKVNGVDVGRVETVELSGDGRSAVVILRLNGSVSLPGNAIARLRQTSILGEKYVDLSAPTAAEPAGSLGDGAVIPLEDSSLPPEIEEVFGALSLLLNGGGVGQIQNITRELNDALGGNESAARSLLTNLNVFIGGLDDHRAEITRALDSLNRLAVTLGGRKEQIDVALTDLTPGIEVLAQQREQLVTMLNSLAGLTNVAVDTVNRSKEDLVADLTALQPTLRKLADSGAALPQAMEMLLTFPFPDSALQTIRGDYLNSYLNLDAVTASSLMGPGGSQAAGGLPGPVLPLPSAEPVTIAPEGGAG